MSLGIENERKIREDLDTIDRAAQRLALLVSDGGAHHEVLAVKRFYEAFVLKARPACESHMKRCRQSRKGTSTTEAVAMMASS